MGVCMGIFRARVLFSVFLIGYSSPQPSVQASVSRAGNEIVLSGNDWKLGSFEMGNGEKRGAFLPNFDDQAFRTVEVPGEVQLQVGLRGMDLYYQSKSLTLINQTEWWYRKHSFVNKSQAGRLLRLNFDGVDPRR